VAFTQVAVTGTYQYADGTPASGAVVFTPTAVMRNGAHVVEASRTVQIVAGAISTTLAATDNPGTTPTGVSYQVTTHIAGARARETYYLEVPYNGGAIDLDDVARSVEEPTQVVTYLTQAAADARYEPLGGGSAAAGRAAALALILGS
jgi:hypothetical protein